MMYFTTVQNFRMKYVILEATQNDKFWQMLEVSKSVLFLFLDPWICEFCTAKNTESFIIVYL
jgi:hypothetical protein